MTALADTPTSLEVHPVTKLNRLAMSAGHLRLLPSGDGWSLIGPTGELVFFGLGAAGRRRCLEFARSRGVLTLLT